MELNRCRPAHLADTPACASCILSEGELTPGIQASEFAQRRDRLCSALPPGSVVVLQAANPQYMAGIIPYPYRQDPDFFYMTGVNQVAVAVIQTDPSPQGGTKHRYMLFVEPPNFEKARWDGEWLDLEAARSVFGAHEAYHTTQLRQHLLDMIRHAPVVLQTQFPLAFSKDVQWALSHRLSNPNSATQPEQPTSQGTAAAAAAAAAAPHRGRIAQANAKPSLPAAASLEGNEGSHATKAAAKSGAASIQRTLQTLPLTPIMHAIRMQKSAAEVKLLQNSAHLSANALRRCMEITKPGVSEQSLAATFEYDCKLRGASRMAFPQVVAGGPDACTIHYCRNDKVLQDGQLVLMDAGCELHGYVSDVTRTWPVGKRFSGPQRDVYEAVLDTHARCIAACRPGSGSIQTLHQLSIQLTCEALKQLKLVPQGASMDAIAAHFLNTFYWHSLAHNLGLDTHDAASMGHSRLLQPGHCLTIEPGLYIPDEPQFGALRGIGVRIEDDVIITDKSCQVLSAAVPVSVKELEEIVGSG